LDIIYIYIYKLTTRLRTIHGAGPRKKKKKEERGVGGGGRCGGAFLLVLLGLWRFFVFSMALIEWSFCSPNSSRAIELWVF
jgi:hypothetical protein